MAEARRAVEPYPSLKLNPGIDPSQPKAQVAYTHQGLSLFIPGPKLLLTGVFHKIRSGFRKAQHAFMPFPVPMVFGAVFGAVGFLATSQSKLAFNVRNSGYANLLWNFDSKMPFVKYFSNKQRVAYLTFNTSIAIMIGFTAFHRLLLRGLLKYHGWMSEGRGKKSLKTIIWGLLLKYVYIQGSKVSMLAYQGCLPALPLPPVRDTLDRYLETMEPILPAEEFAELKAAADKFEKNEAKKLQGYLWWKWLLSTNYVSDWWLDVVYLRDRNSLMINSNYYGLSMPTNLPTHSQVDRAAYTIVTCARAGMAINGEKHPPMLIQDLVPICMKQYDYHFSTTREPGAEQDKLVKYNEFESRHVVVYHKGKFFKVKLFSESSGRLLTPNELKVTLQGILDDRETPDAYESQIPVLTTWNRTKWYETRQNEFMRNRVNKQSLKALESAMFYVVLDTDAHEATNFTAKGRQYLHNNGRKLWMDKSFCLTFDTKGDHGLTGEHSWGDAPAAGHMIEWTLATEAAEEPYEKDGSLKETSIFRQKSEAGTERFYRAQRMNWTITENLKAAIDEAGAEADKAITRLDLCSQEFNRFGKPTITKKCKCSPDAFIQMAIQLAFYRDQGKFVQTYESAMTRLYREGRTETIRSQSKKSCAFVLAMEDSSVSNTRRLELLRAACEAHSKYTQLAMIGKGVDRHLFALYVVAVGTGTESPFLQTVLKRGWKLSTSQIPQTQAPHKWARCKLDKGVDCGDVYPRPSGGFGPIADDGYGVCYCIGGSKSIFFHCSASNNAENTDADRMYGRIDQALQDLAALVELSEAEKKNKE